MNRREVLKSLFTYVPLGVAFTGFAAMGLRFITPVKRNKEKRIFLLHLSDLKINESKEFKDLKGKNLMLVRIGEKSVKALSTSCSHLGCTVYWQKDKNRFYCPCHEGVFDPNGEVVSGPPPAPLDKYKIEIEGDNIFIYFKEKEA